MRGAKSKSVTWFVQGVLGSRRKRQAWRWHTLNLRQLPRPCENQWLPRQLIIPWFQASSVSNVSICFVGFSCHKWSQIWHENRTATATARRVALFPDLWGASQHLLGGQGANATGPGGAIFASLVMSVVPTWFQHGSNLFQLASFIFTNCSAIFSRKLWMKLPVHPVGPVDLVLPTLWFTSVAFASQAQPTPRPSPERHVVRPRSRHRMMPQERIPPCSALRNWTKWMSNFDGLWICESTPQGPTVVTICFMVCLIVDFVLACPRLMFQDCEDDPAGKPKKETSFFPQFWAKHCKQKPVAWGQKHPVHGLRRCISLSARCHLQVLNNLLAQFRTVSVPLLLGRQCGHPEDSSEASAEPRVAFPADCGSAAHRFLYRKMAEETLLPGFVIQTVDSPQWPPRPWDEMGWDMLIVKVRIGEVGWDCWRGWKCWAMQR